MNDLEKRAHDIAVQILPKIIEDAEPAYYSTLDGELPFFNAIDVVNLYKTIYEDLLIEFRNQEARHDVRDWQK